jgi:hypothetical protein
VTQHRAKTICFLFLLIALAVLPATSNADDCGNGLPCGPIPWQLPPLPGLVSPSPIPTIAITVAPTATPGGPTPTRGGPTSAPGGGVPTFDVDTSGINHQMETLTAQLNSPVQQVVGSPLDWAGSCVNLYPNFISWPTGWSASGGFTKDSQNGLKVQMNGISPQTLLQTGISVDPDTEYSLNFAVRNDFESAIDVEAGLGAATHNYEISPTGGEFHVIKFTPGGSVELGGGLTILTLTFSAPDVATAYLLYACVAPSNITIDPNGTSQMSQIAANAGDFFGYAKTVSTVSFGSLSPLISFGFTAMVVVLTTKILSFILPLVSALFGIVRKIISLILDFLPF